MIKHANLLPREIPGVYEKLKQGKGPLKRQSVRKWIKERRYAKTEAPNYDADAQEERTDRACSLKGIGTVEYFKKRMKESETSMCSKGQDFGAKSGSQGGDNPGTFCWGGQSKAKGLRTSADIDARVHIGTTKTIESYKVIYRIVTR